MSLSNTMDVVEKLLDQAGPMVTIHQGDLANLQEYILASRMIVGDISENPYVIDMATVPIGKQPFEAPDETIMNLVMSGGQYQALVDLSNWDDVD